MQGHGWAAGICAALALLVLAMFVYGGFFAFLWLVSLVVRDVPRAAPFPAAPRRAAIGNFGQPAAKETSVEAIVLD
jgi:hypothetical protein